jgi:hypothetical protein
MDQEVNINPEELSSFAELVGIHENIVQGFWVLYIIILILSIVVFKLGFARKLPPLKSAVIYIFLALGCIPLTFFGIGYPVAEGLLIAAIILIIYKIRLHQSKKENQVKG